MSLKAFHILFVALSTLLAVLFAAWSFQGFVESASAAMLTAAVGAILFAVGMVVYGVWFLRKLKHVSFL